MTEKVKVEDFDLDIDIDETKHSDGIGNFDEKILDTVNSFMLNQKSHMVLVGDIEDQDDVAWYVKKWFMDNPDKSTEYSNFLCDYIYVENLIDRNRPKLLVFPSGTGQIFIEEMTSLKEKIVELDNSWDTLISTCSEKDQIIKDITTETSELIKSLQEDCKQNGILMELNREEQFSIVPNPQPIPGNEENFDECLYSCQPSINEFLRTVVKINGEALNKLIELKNSMAQESVSELFKDLKQDYDGYDDVLEFLEEAEEEVVEIISERRCQKEQAAAQEMKKVIMGVDDSYDSLSFLDIRPFRFVEEIPVISEKSVGVSHLIGCERKIMKYGMYQSGVEFLSPGLFHEANGGVLIINVMDLFRHPYAYEVLEQVMLNKKISIESIDSIYGLEQTVSMKPEPIPFDCKIIMIIPEFGIYQKILNLDNDFSSIFASSYSCIIRDRFNIKNNQENVDHIVKLVNHIADRVTETDLTKESIYAILKYIAELNGSKKVVHLDSKINKKIEKVLENILSTNTEITPETILNSINSFKERINCIETDILDWADENLHIDPTLDLVGVINALVVYRYSDLIDVGEPSRVTAVHSYNPGGDIKLVDSQTDMAGNLLKKAELTIKNYLKSTFAKEATLNCEIGLSFEQSYASKIDGDSASLAKVISIMSSLSNTPIKQRLAITGSMDQLGNVQPIGGVNAKVRGFWKFCKMKGVKNAGVVIPLSNKEDLISSDKEFLNDINEGRFNVYPVASIKEASEIMMDTPYDVICCSIEQSLDFYRNISRKKESKDE